jgi:hypothetical protein
LIGFDNRRAIGKNPGYFFSSAVPVAVGSRPHFRQQAGNDSDKKQSVGEER